MMRVVLFVLLASALSGCYQTENGLVFGKPDYENRNIVVSQIDLDILLKADVLLKDEALWRRDAVRVCSESSTLNLYCVLERASIEVTGKYMHRQPALQEIRFVIDDYYRNRWGVHRLAEFNAHPDTSFNDIKFVIAKAIGTVKTKLRITLRSRGTPQKRGAP